MLYDLSEEEKNNLIGLLDRVTLTGHKERLAMNAIINKLVAPIDPTQFTTDNTTSDIQEKTE